MRKLPLVTEAGGQNVRTERPRALDEYAKKAKKAGFS
jgi:hypothetical protein